LGFFDRTALLKIFLSFADNQAVMAIEDKVKEILIVFDFGMAGFCGIF